MRNPSSLNERLKSIEQDLAKHAEVVNKRLDALLQDQQNLLQLQQNRIAMLRELLQNVSGIPASNGAISGQFWQWMGSHYDCSLSGLDFDYDVVPPESSGKHAVVANYGYTQQFSNQLNAFKIIHDLTAPGGVMFHKVPSCGMVDHGLLTYNPKFFWMLARSNGYKVLYMNYEIRETSQGAIIIALQKTYDIPFVPPIDVNSGSTTENEELKQRYWTVFNADAFANLPTW
jgi:hypothetical protein